MKIRLIHLLGSLLLFPNIGFTIEQDLCKQTTKVYFGNGVWNSEIEAEKSQLLLQERLDAIIKGSELEGGLKFGTSYNPSEGALLDLIETFQQNYTDDFSKFWRFISEVDPLPDFLQEKFIQIANEMDADLIKGNPSIQRHIEQYTKDLIEGNEVVVVAHSQGNLYANIAYSGIASLLQPGFGIVAVASPSEKVATEGPYTTIEEDVIIASVYDSMKPNINNFFGFIRTDFSGHTFAKSYMAPNHRAEKKILKDILRTIVYLPDLETMLGMGPISAYLSWGEHSDLDLHIYEPNGDHVYYQNFTGTSGSLDRDNTDGKGPEHYFVTCDKLEIGTYRFGVNYYEGDGIEQGTVLLQAGEQVYLRSNIYGVERGSAGNDDPRMVFDVIVTGSEEEGYQFEVQ